MNKPLQDILKNFPIVFNHGLRTFLMGLGNMCIAILVLDRVSAAIWGQFVPYLLWMGLAIHLLSWGNKEYLLRKFSLADNNDLSDFNRVLFTRGPLLLLAAVVTLLVFPSTIGFVLACWMICFFLYQSLDALITYQQAFARACLAEFIGLLTVILPLIIWPASVNLIRLCSLFALSYFIRSVLLVLFIRTPALQWSFDPAYLKTAFPFLLLSLVGLLSSKIDMYTATAYLKDEDLGLYQLLTSALGFVRAGAGIVAYAFIRNIYNLEWAALHRWIKNLILLGFFASCIGAVALFLLVNWYLGHDLPVPIFSIAVFYAWPAYAITLCVISLFRVGQERIVIYLSLINLAVNLLLSCLLFPRFGIVGGLIAGATATTLIAIIHLSFFQKRTFFTPHNGKE